MDKKRDRELKSKYGAMMRHQMVDELVRRDKERETQITRIYDAAIELFITTSEEFISKLQQYEKYNWYKTRTQETLARIFELAESEKGQVQRVIIGRLKFLRVELSTRLTEQSNAAIDMNEQIVMQQFEKWLSFCSLMQDEIGKVLDKSQNYPIKNLLSLLGDRPELERWQDTLKTIAIRDREKIPARWRCAEYAQTLKETQPDIYDKKFGMQKAAMSLIRERHTQSKLMRRLPAKIQDELDWLIEPYEQAGYLINGSLPDDFDNPKRYGDAIRVIAERLGDARREYEATLSTDDN